jgi:flagellar biosynthetic protein FlhB
MNAPKVVAKGQDYIALRIREIAKENKVPVVENPPLARSLFSEVEMNQDIQPNHYKAVADVIRFVMKLKKQQF